MSQLSLMKNFKPIFLLVLKMGNASKIQLVPYLWTKKNTWRNKKDKYNYKAKKKVMRRGGKNEAKKSRSREWQAL